jgi:ribose transport system ATP-binding protein
MAAPLLTMSGISKRFAATQALDGVSLSVHAGEVHALVGENGAGKSTLMKLLSGAIRLDAGSMTLAGKPYAPASPAAAIDNGVAMIYQELNLAPHLSVEDNILLGQERSRWGWLRRGEQRRLARKALDQLARPDLPLTANVGELPIAAQQIVEIARALISNARVLVFDEPTSSLSEADTAHLFQVIRQLRDAGLGIVYISHFLHEVAQACDTYTVLRDGRVAGNGQMPETTLDQIVHMMVGRELTELFPRVPHQPGDPLLEVRGLASSAGPTDINLTVRRGEVLGIAGLIGSGRSELVRAIYGLAEVTSGSVRVADVNTAGAPPRKAIRRGLGLVSEDRKQEGLAIERSIADNLTLTHLQPYERWGWLNLARRRDGVTQQMARIGCKAAGPDQPVGELSGGNQQKIAIARLLHQEADLLLLDEPTRGIDIGTKAEIYRLIGTLAAQGKGVVMVSSYLPELLGVCDTIGVMCRGRLVEVRPAGEWTAEAVMHAATGQGSAA